MSYKVALPPEIKPEEGKHSPSLPKITGETGEVGEETVFVAGKSRQDKGFPHQYPHHSSPLTGEETGKVSDETGEEMATPGHLELVVVQRSPIPPPIRIAPAEVVTNPELFIARSLEDLAVWVEAQNRGAGHWMENLLDEKIERLRLCGVIVEVRRIQ